jgi:hypothetical protein
MNNSDRQLTCKSVTSSNGSLSSNPYSLITHEVNRGAYKAASKQLTRGAEESSIPKNEE